MAEYINPFMRGMMGARQANERTQAQEFGILSQLAQLRNSEEAAQQAREMRPLQLEMLRGQIEAQKAQAPLKALELQQKTQQIGAQGLLSGLMLSGGYQGPTSAPTAVAQNDADALRMVQEADARGQPLGVNVPNPQNVRALGAVAYPQEFGKSLFPKPMAPGAPVKVPDKNSPTGFSYVSREQALGMSAPPAGANEGGTPYFTPVPTATGVMSFNNRTGGMSPISVGGVPVIRDTSDPRLQGDIAAAKAGGRVAGDAGAQATLNLPQVTAKAEQALSLIDQMVGSADGKTKPHPGFSSYVGATLTPGMRFVEGSDAAGYQSLENQIKGGAFLQAFEALKGGGQITEVEGKKATDAITRMNKAQSESEYIRAAREFQDVIRAGVQRAKQRAAGDRRAAPRDSTQRIVVDY